MRERNCGRIIYTDPTSGITSIVASLPGEPIISEEDFDGLTRDVHISPSWPPELAALSLLWGRCLQR